MSDLEKAYRKRFDSILQSLANEIERHLYENFKDHLHIDRIMARPKSVERFLLKAQITEEGKQKYSEPLQQIQDQIGARIVVFYLSDIEKVEEIIKRYYRSIEAKSIVPDSEWKFGYFGRHHILLIPSEVTPPSIDKDLLPTFFELQVKTLFQHAWSEANHDLGYKPGAAPLSPNATRQLAFTAAQAWGADRIFNELSQKPSD